MQKIQSWFAQWTKPTFLWWALVVIGIITRVRQYFSGRSLWADEASLAYNLAHRTFAGLTQPLDYEQGAPIGYLFIEKTLVVLFGNIDQVMRLFPLFSGILAVYLFCRIAQTHIRGGMFAALLFAISWPLIYYSSELKQYSSDVMIGLLLIFLSTRCLKEDARPNDFLILGIAGTVAIWISHPSAFILAGIGLALFLTALTKSRPMLVGWLFGLGAMWALSFSVEYLVSLRHLVADDYLYNYWKKAFMPLPPGGTRIWLGRTYYSLLLTTLNRTDQILAVLIPVLILIGGLSLLYQEWQFAIIISSPFFIALFASVVQKYPLKDRFMLFLAPLVLFLIAEGLGCIYTLIAKLHKGIASIIYIIPVLVLFLLPASVTWENFLVPSVRTNVKPVLQYVSEHGQKDEIIYIFHTSDSTFAYYAPFYGLEDENVIFGKDSFVKQEALDGFYNDVQTLKGKDRVWFIFSGIVDCGGCEGDMQSFYVNYLNKQGTMLDSVHSVDANAYLYDLNP